MAVSSPPRYGGQDRTSAREHYERLAAHIAAWFTENSAAAMFARSLDCMWPVQSIRGAG
jgi:hypothetical protein